MRRDLQRMSVETHDLLVIGGGIQGVAIAREAARRRWRVALVEQSDFGAATSMNSQRMIHGGARYLQNLDFARMRRSVLDRRAWMREFPHLIRPIPILVPSFEGMGKSPALIRLGMTLYEFSNFDRDAGLAPSHRIPRHHALSREAVLAAAPALKGLPVTGAVVFHDAIVLDSERLTLALAHEAWREGARLANHARAVDLWVERGRVAGARVRDEMDGTLHDVRATHVVHAGGPWAARSFARTETSMPARSGVGLVRAMALLTRSIDDRHAIAVPSRSAGRLYFVTPWHGHSLVGVDEIPFDGDPSSWSMSRSEIERFLRDVNESLPGAQLAIGDVRRVFAGLLPVSEDDPRVLAREDRVLVDDDGLVRVLGVKYTTAPSLARRVLDQELGLRRGDDATGAERATTHGELDDAEEIDEIRRADPAAREVLLEAPRVDFAEIVWAVRRRMALTLEDIALRRTPLAMLGEPPLPALERAAEIAGALLGWDATRRASEIRSVRDRFTW